MKRLLCLLTALMCLLAACGADSTATLTDESASAGSDAAESEPVAASNGRNTDNDVNVSAVNVSKTRDITLGDPCTYLSDATAEAILGAGFTTSPGEQWDDQYCSYYPAVEPADGVTSIRIDEHAEKNIRRNKEHQYISVNGSDVRVDWSLRGLLADAHPSADGQFGGVSVKVRDGRSMSDESMQMAAELLGEVLANRG